MILEKYLAQADEDSISRLYTLIEDVKDLDPSIKIHLRHQIMERYPDFKFYGVVEKGTVARGLLATQESYAKKTMELQHLLEVEVPKNSAEIGAAIEMGDLRENAEYKAAKERQEYLNTTASKLKEEIDKAQIVKAEGVKNSAISFGTKVGLLNKENNEEETYTILGPWESNPQENIISYLSPFGSALLNHTIGETLSFTINEREYTYLVQTIEVAIT
jgi:transcription elongation factor GreA